MAYNTYTGMLKDIYFSVTIKTNFSVDTTFDTFQG